MNIIRNIIGYAATLSVAAITLQSCSLEEVIPDAITEEKIKDEKDVSSLIDGTYALLNNPEGFKYNGGLTFLFLAGDDLYAAGGGELETFSNKAFGPNNTHTFWNTFYSTIGNANNVIDHLDKMDLSPEFKKRAYGEAYFLRAFSYYYLVRLYGGVPLRTRVVTRDSDFYLKRSEVDEVYAQIFDDFKKAAERLPLRSDLLDAELGRATKGAALGFLAQAYLTFGNQLDLAGHVADAHANYALARNYCDSVINSGQYVLLSDYGQLFNLANETGAYNEVMFGVRFSADPLRRGYGAAGSEFAYRFLGSNSWNVTGNKPNGNGAAHIRPQPWYTDFYYSGDYGTGTPQYGQPDHDYRAQISNYQRGSNGTLNPVTGENFRWMYMYPVVHPEDSRVTGAASSTTSVIGKYIDPAGYDSRNHGNDFFVMRYAEIFLIKAEVLNELNGPTQESIDLINELRHRARNADGTPREYPTLVTLADAPTKEALRRKIFEERGAEFLAEGLRWFDLVRMKSHVNPSETMYDYQFGTFLPTLSPKTPSWQASQQRWNPNTRGGYIPGSVASITYHPKFKLFPIPTSELIINPNFGPQNPGWQ